MSLIGDTALDPFQASPEREADARHGDQETDGHEVVEGRLGQGG